MNVKTRFVCTFSMLYKDLHEAINTYSNQRSPKNLEES